MKNTKDLILLIQAIILSDRKNLCPGLEWCVVGLLFPYVLTQPDDMYSREHRFFLTFIKKPTKMGQSLFR